MKNIENEIVKSLQESLFRIDYFFYIVDK